MNSTSSNPQKAPKHLQKRKEFREHQVKAAEEQKSKRQIGIVLVIFALVIGAGLFVYNMDEIYLKDKKNITLSYSTRFEQGGNAPIIISLTDFNDEPVPDEEVIVELEYKINNITKQVTLVTETTDDNGAIKPILDLPEEFNGTAELVVSIGEQKVSQPITIEKPTETSDLTEERLRILVSTDKPLYQPGQTINIRALAMYGENYGVYSDDITIEVDDPDGNKLSRAELVCNEWGIAGTNFTVTDQMPIGNYKILAKVGEVEAKKSVTVKRYVLPKFNMVFNEIKSWYTVDEDISGSINCKYFFGKPVKGEIKFSARTYYGGTWATVYQTTGLLSDDGDFEFTVPAIEYAVGLPSNQDNGLVELNATITDYSGHAETKLMPISIARQPILITAISDTNIRGADSKYYFLAQAPDGSVVGNANLTAELDSIQIFSGTTNTKGFAEVDFIYSGQQDLSVTVEKSSISATEDYDLKASTGLKLTAEKMYYKVGDHVEFDVFYAGESFTNWVYYDVLANGFTVTTGNFKLSSGTVGTGSFSLDITPEMVGTTYVRVYKIEKDEDVVTDRLELAVAPVSGLNVDIEKDDDIYNPQQPVKLKFIITENGQAVQGALGVAIIDQSLYALSERFGGFQDIYFELEQTALEPRYQVWEYIFNPDTPGTSIPLPETNILDPSEYQEGYSYPKIGLLTNRNTEMDNAETVKSNYINVYWGGIFILFFVSLIGLTVFGVRQSKPIFIVLILIILVIATVIAGILININDINFTTEPETEKAGFLPMDQNKDAGGAGGGGGNQTNIWDGDDIDNDMIPRDWEMMDGEGVPMPAAKDTDADGDFIPDSNEPAHNTDQYDWDSDDDLIQREQREVQVREWFPETWYWNPVLITDEAGVAELELTTPDSITTWEIKAVANTKNAKIGVNNENLTVFKQFFIEPDIPVSVIRNDTFPLRIMVYNYDNVSRETTVYLEDSEWFEALDKTTKKVTVPADNVSKVMFTIRALDVGEHNVTLSGFNGEVWDDIIKPMRVDPDGKRVSETINGKLTDSQTKSETLTLSPDRVPNSENAFIKLQAGMEAVLLDGAETFIRHVSGCGEQSMSSLNIDILAFDTVQKLGTATEEKMFEYEQITTQGIQHELQYLVNAKNGVGRGIVWFPDDPDVHQWLTSWGLLTFQDAVDAGFNIDPTIIPDMQAWLLSQQEDDGSFVFPERGLYEFTNPILRAKTVSCSAYITRSLIYSGYPTSNAQIQKAVTYLEDHAKDNWEDPYTIALVLIVLEDAEGDSTIRTDLATRLEELKVDDTANGTAYWSSGTSMITDSDEFGFWGRSLYGYGSNYHSIETTGYATMALAKHKGSASATVQKAVKYLIENRQGLGGWFSTQDTVVAFQALKVAGSNSIEELNIKVFAEGSLVDQITFDDTNLDLTYLIDLRPYLGEATEIKLQSTGTGSVMYQIYKEEYIPWAIIGADKPQELILTISYDATNIKVNDQIKASLELKYMGVAEHIKMVLVDLRAPVGFSFVEEDFDDMKTTGKISQYEINNRQAYLYIEDLSYGQTITVTYHLLANDPIRGTIQGIQAYDMYNPKLTTELEPVEVVSTN